MPLRDHFHPPLSERRRWEGVHATWPTWIVQQLLPVLPEGFYAEPWVRLGVNFEIDVGTTDTDEFDEYAVEVYDHQTLVATIEIVSPGNKDRAEARTAFASKVAALLRRGVCVSIVDVVTERHFNLYAAALEILGLTDPTLANPAPSIYAATIRKRSGRTRNTAVDSWFYPLVLGQNLATIPLWLDETMCRTVDLEASYEETCRTLRIA